jgi:hypothetical protein
MTHELQRVVTRKNLSEVTLNEIFSGDGCNLREDSIVADQRIT